ncbi:MAG: hypothetical protein ABIN94_07795 [Ferruginibacter sp.]
MNYFAVNTHFNVAVQLAKDACKILDVPDNCLFLTYVSDQRNLLVVNDQRLINFLGKLALKTDACKPLNPPEAEEIINTMLTIYGNYGNRGLMNGIAGA